MSQQLADELLVLFSDLQRAGAIPTQVPVEDIAEAHDLGSLGIDSAARISLQASIEDKWSVVLDDEHFRSWISFRELVTFIEDKINDQQLRLQSDA